MHILGKIVGRLLSIAIILGALAASIYVTRLTYHQPRTDDAAVRANLVGIAPHVSGPIVELYVEDNQEVEAGDLLFVIDPQPFEVELERSKAALLLTQSEVRALSNAVAAATVDVKRLKDESTYAGDHVKRIEQLVGDKFVTQDRFEEARVKQRSAMASLERAQQELARQKNSLAQFGDVNARLKAAEAAVHGVELNLSYCRVRAPFKARVTNLNISIGEYARAGQQVFALVDTRAWYIIANFQETYLEAIRPGMEVEVFLMSYPNQRFHGIVQGLGWAVALDDGSSVGVLPEVKRTVNWVRLAQRIPVRIKLDEPDPDRPYRMGMSAVVTIRGGRNPGDASAGGATP
jgi:multidrug efflux system membrane fusion protein